MQFIQVKKNSYKEKALHPTMQNNCYIQTKHNIHQKNEPIQTTNTNSIETQQYQFGKKRKIQSKLQMGIPRQAIKPEIPTQKPKNWKTLSKGYIKLVPKTW